MKNRLNIVSIGVFIIMALSGCDNQSSDASQDEGVNLIELGGRFYSYRLTDNLKDDEEEVWKANRYVGMYLQKEIGDTPVDECKNIKYESLSNPKRFMAMAPEEAFSTPTDKSGVTVVGYAPYNEKVEENIYPLEFTNQNNNPELQFYYASKSDALFKDHCKTFLEFRPVLTKALFKLVPDVGVEQSELSNASISIIGMYTKAGFDLLKGTFTQGTDVAPISLECGDSYESTALLLPSNSVEGYNLTITLPGLKNSTREWNFTEALSELSSGMQYTFTITVTPNSMNISVEQTPIANWGEEGGNNGVNDIEENLISAEIDNMAEGDLRKVQKYEDVPDDSWFYRYYTGEDATSFAKIESDNGRKVVHAQLAADANVTAADKIVGCHLQNAPKGIFTIKFIAKATEKVKMEFYLRADTKRYIASTGNKGSAGIDILSDDYQSYSIDFNFGKTVANTWSSGNEIDATDTDLANVYVGFNFNHKAGDVKLYDLRIIRKK